MRILKVESPGWLDSRRNRLLLATAALAGMALWSQGSTSTPTRTQASSPPGTSAAAPIPTLVAYQAQGKAGDSPVPSQAASGQADRLVPESDYSGGALVACDARGQDTRLSLRRYHVDVYIEDGFARTTLDQTYFNDSSFQREGTFLFPLPPDASLSRLAMYVDGKRMEGGMAERDYARGVFDSIVNRRRDPALLEWVDGNTFKMRVFPLEARQAKRIILSYTQRLPSTFGRVQYHFPIGHSLQWADSWSWHALVKGGAALTWKSNCKGVAETKAGNDLLLDAAIGPTELGGELVVELVPRDPLPANQAVARFFSAELDSEKYFMVRYRPQLPAGRGERPRDWIFLAETSADRDRILAQTQIEVVRRLLGQAGPRDRFAVLAAGTQVRAFARELQPATTDQVQSAIQFLEQAHLIGALHLRPALEASRSFVSPGRETFLVHLGSGFAALGENTAESLIRRIPPGAQYVGIGVGRRWAQRFMTLAAARTGGHVTHLNPTEPIAERVRELAAALNAPRLVDVQVVDDSEQALFQSDGRALAQGEELCAIARLDRRRQRMPGSVTVVGSLEGKPFRQELAVREVTDHADYLPRTWARWEIDRLLADNAQENRPRIVALSKSMYVLSPFTSLLVLENEEMYTRFKVDRGRRDHWALYPCPETIPVWKEEPEPGPARKQEREPQPPPRLAQVLPRRERVRRQPSAAEVLDSIIIRMPPQPLYWPGIRDEEGYREYMTALEVYGSAQSAIPWLAAPNSDALSPVSLVAGLGDLASASGWGGEGPGAESVGSYLSFRGLLPGGLGGTGMGVGLAGGFGIAGIGGFGGGLGLGGGLGFGGGLGLAGGGRAQGPRWGAGRGGFSVGGLGLGALGVGGLGLGGMPFHPSLNPAGGGGQMDEEELAGVPGAGQRFAGSDEPGLSDLRSHLQRVLSSGPPVRPWLEGLPADQSAKDRGPLIRLEWFPSLAMEQSSSGAGILDSCREAGGLFLGWARLQTLDQLRNPSLPGAGLKTGLSYLDGTHLPCDNAPASAAALYSRLLKGVETVPAYELPSLHHSERVFHDLVAYAPAMNTSRADVLAVLESEARPDPGSRLGKIDPAARQLIDRARQAGWQALLIPATGSWPGYTVVFDGAGRYAYQRTLPWGLREKVICDGQTLLHLYPELGIGARRTVSRFHRAEFAALVPWSMAPAEDLAHGADLRCTDDRTVAIVPHSPAAAGSPQVWVYLVFHGGRLAERRLVTMPSGQELVRETYREQGDRVRLAAGGHPLPTPQTTLWPAPAPDLKPDVRDLVVLPLPLRSSLHFRDELSNCELEDMPACLSTALGERLDIALLAIFFKHFYELKDQRLGIYTLLASTLPDFERMQLVGDHPQTPLAQYLALIGRDSPGADKIKLTGPQDGFLQRLARLYQLRASWQGGRMTAAPPQPIQAEGRRLLDYLDQQADPYFAWILLDILLQDYPNPDEASLTGTWIGKNNQQERRKEIASIKRQALKAFSERFASLPALAYYARYEYARALRAVQQGEGSSMLVELYCETLKRGFLPPIDADFGALAWAADGAQLEHLILPVKETAHLLTRQGRRPHVLALALQQWQNGNGPLAEELFSLAFGGRLKEEEQRATVLAGVEYLWQTSQSARAVALLQPVLEEPKAARDSGLWRLAAAAARQAGWLARGIHYRERILRIDFADDALFEPGAVRWEFGGLFADYEKLAETALSPGEPATAQFIERVVRSGDRWRSLEDDGREACWATARALLAVGEQEAAWDYLTTPLVGQEPSALPDLAYQLEREGYLSLAARARALAMEAEPGNANLFLGQVKLLHTLGRHAEADALLHRLAEEPWDQQFEAIQREAREQLRK